MCIRITGHHAKILEIILRGQELEPVLEGDGLIREKRGISHEETLFDPEDGCDVEPPQDITLRVVRGRDAEISEGKNLVSADISLSFK